MSPGTCEGKRLQEELQSRKGRDKIKLESPRSTGKDGSV